MGRSSNAHLQGRASCGDSGRGKGALLLAKLVAVCITLASGGSGGVFAPSLFLGAMLGGAVGFLVNQIDPTHSAPTGAYALVGMGSVVAATTRAPITTILIIFELTSDYRIMLPLMISTLPGHRGWSRHPR